MQVQISRAKTSYHSSVCLGASTDAEAGVPCLKNAAIQAM
jgi:hypothetical protein